MSNSNHTRADRRAVGDCVNCGKEPALETSDLGAKCTKIFVKRTRAWRKKNKLKVKAGSSWSARIHGEAAMKKGKKNAVEIEPHEGVDYIEQAPTGSFGTLVTMPRRQHAREHQSLGARPGGSTPDKRSRVDPVPAEIPSRSGGPILF